MSDPGGEQEDGLERIRELYRATPMLRPEGRRRVHDALLAEPSPNGFGRLARFWHEPRWFTARPWALAAAVVALMVVGAGLERLISWRSAEHDQKVAALLNAKAAADSMTVVHFTLSAPGAASISLVGDFNEWDASATPMRQTASGVWSVSIPLSHGRHVYAFVVNTARWVNDPGAPLAPEDGFGVRNSVVVVGWPGGT